ncbi:MAG: LuxR C-terminal-related transcriptional regulator [Desulfobacteraceae bacterium]
MAAYSNPISNLSTTDPPYTASCQSQPLIYIVGHNMQNNQMLRFLLQTELSAFSTCHREMPIKTFATAISCMSIIYLLDCIDCDISRIDRSIYDGDESHHDLSIVLFNLRSGFNAAQLGKHDRIRGIFYTDDGLATFLEGMRAIVTGRKWIKYKKRDSTYHSIYGNKDHPDNSLQSVSLREKEILRLVAIGMSNKQIAEEFEISLHTVKTHIYNIYKKIDVPNRLQAALWATAHLPDRIDKHL